MRGKAGRKDYTLTRDGQMDQALLEDGQTDDPKKQSASIFRLLTLAKEEFCLLFLASLALLVASLATIAVPKLVGTLIDTCISYTQGTRTRAEAMHGLNKVLYQLLVLLAVGGAATGLRSWLFNSAAERVMWRVRKRLFRVLSIQEIGFFDCVRTGELMNRLSEDTRLMKTAGTISISVALRSTVVACLGLVLMFLTSVVLSLLTLAILPVCLVALRFYSMLNKKYVREGLTCSAEASTVAEEVFGSIRTVRSFAKEDACCEKYEDAQNRVLKWGIKSALISGVFFSFNYVFATGSLLVILWYGARLVVDGKLTAGSLSTFVIYALYVGGNTASVANVISQLIQAVGASERVFQLLDRSPRMAPAGEETPIGSEEGGRIDFQNVWFAYPSRPDVEVLKGVTLSVPPGRKLALVGPSGGGKSTIVNLIQRFYEPKAGVVLLDGTPLGYVDHHYLHQQVSIVAQEPVLFAETIFYNIAFGLRRGINEASLSQVEDAAKLANAHDFISAFPMGYQTMVGERGVRLSGGQKQRIAIARAILTRPRVLLLDEATSALDAESEALVQEALDRVAHGRTVITIAHRLSTVQSATEVAVIQAGQIAELGSHEDLLQKGGVYAALVRRQLQAGSRPPSRNASMNSISEEGGLPPKTNRSKQMSRQDTGAIVDELFNSIIGGTSAESQQPGRSSGENGDSERTSRDRNGVGSDPEA